MLFWIYAGIVVYAGIVMLPSFYLFGQIGVMGYVQGRDQEPVAGPAHGRALRAARNTKENMPIFLVLAVLAIVIDGTDMPKAIIGAQMFVLSRVIYAPAYMSGIPFLRSAVYTVGLIGLVMMGLAIG